MLYIDYFFAENLFANVVEQINTPNDCVKVPYATVLEMYINTCFLIVLGVASITFAFSWTFSNRPINYSANFEVFNRFF